MAGNFIDGAGLIEELLEERAELPAWLKMTRKGTFLAEPAPVAPVKTHSAREAYQRVLNQAGCFPRDRVTSRTLQEVTQGTGAWGRKVPAALSDDWYLAELKRNSPLLDSDSDGIPDEWEDAHGLNKADPLDHNLVLPSGYTAIDLYINEKASLLVNTDTF